MRPLRWVLSFVLMLAAAFACASCGPPYSYVRMGTPSPFLGARQVSLEPVHFESMLVGDQPVDNWLAGKSAEQQASHMADRSGFADRFASRLSERTPVNVLLGPPPDPSTLVLRPVVLRYEPGVFAYVYNIDTEVTLALQVVRPDGVVLEEVQFHSRVAASMINPASGTRLRIAGEQIGSFIATYLQHRVQGIAAREAARLTALF